MYKYEFTSYAFKQLKRLPKNTQKRLMSKLDYYCKQENPLRFADYLTDARIGEYRFRVGDWRIVFDVEGDKIVILIVGHRRDIYR